jgi:23S rRNA pseudouridine1911/1915/1917 synthase
MNILYEDNHLIAVYKPAGVLVQGDKTGDVSIMEDIKKYLKEKYAKPGDVFLGLIHRLDRNVAGVVLFAKTSKGASRLSEQFREHTVQKIYHAWVLGVPAKKKAVLKNYLVHHERNNKTEVFDEEVPGSDYAELSYEIVDERGDGVAARALLKVELKTGRQHQIRAQLSHIGHPILGDVKYASTKAFSDQHIALYATELHFNSATPAQGTDATTRVVTREVVSIPVPEEVW